jgi:hypothetical protein
MSRIQNAHFLPPTSGRVPQKGKRALPAVYLSERYSSGTAFASPTAKCADDKQFGSAEAMLSGVPMLMRLRSRAPGGIVAQRHKQQRTWVLFE